MSVPTRAGAMALAASVLLSGCMGGGGSPPAAGVSAAGQPAAAVAQTTASLGDPRYCPELRVRDGTEVLRRYEQGHEDEAPFVVWQASIGDTARQCSYDAQGNMRIRIGVSGRVIAGPKGGPGAISAPLRIAVVKYQEAVLASQIYPLAANIPAENSTLFSQVQEVTVPSPGGDRDYIIYVGFDDGKEVPIGKAGAAAPAPTAREAAMEDATLDGETLLEN